MSLNKAYNPVTEEIVEKLRDILGAKYIIYDDPEKLEAYSHDEVAEKSYAHMPEAVVRPDSAEQIAEIMMLANRENIPVTPRGAGSGLSGGAGPIYVGIVLLVERMNKPFQYDFSGCRHKQLRAMQARYNFRSVLS